MRRAINDFSYLTEDTNLISIKSNIQVIIEKANSMNKRSLRDLISNLQQSTDTFDQENKTDSFNKVKNCVNALQTALDREYDNL